jgi:Rrf2 family protein
MLKLSRQTDLSLLLLTDLSRLKRGESLSLSAWAKTTKLPYRFLTKVAGQLVKAGLIKSREGRSGGYRLAKKAQEISVSEVLNKLEGKTEPVKCLRGETCVAEGFCGHKHLMGKMSGFLDDYLASVSLKDLC